MTFNSEGSQKFTFSSTELESIVRAEIETIEKYQKVLDSEKEAITKFDTAKLELLVEKREALCDSLKDLQERRKVIHKSFPQAHTKKLSELVEIHCEPVDKKKILPLLKKLRSTTEESDKKNTELGSIARFGLGLVDGLVSIFYSANQNVTRSYTRMGSIQERNQPAGSLKDSVLKKV